MKYDPNRVEKKWQQYWEQNGTFSAPIRPTPGQKKMYVLDMFPYPSANGLHVGHPEGYTATDIVCRFERMNGSAVLHPMGWDAFGLPAEQQAKKTGIPPRTITETNIGNFRRQLKMLGFSYDWARELATTDVDYFRWTQFIFLVLFDTWYDPVMQKGRAIAELPIPTEIAGQGEDAIREYQDDHRLAYQIEAPVNWCPALGTVLSNEEVIGGRSERGNHPVVRMPLRQWMLRITAYADRLENDLDGLDWSESIKSLQRNWIGRSTGAEVDFYIGNGQNCGQLGESEGFAQWKEERKKQGFPYKPGEDVLRIYTTRPDTLFGATYMVIAPEHPLIERLIQPGQKEAVDAYRQEAAFKSDLDRTDLAQTKTGVFTGSYAINPINGKPIPIWVADYVLISYGTGAIMSVPAHDTRDFEFAQKFGLPIIQVVQPKDGQKLKSGTCFTEEGVAINSGDYEGLATEPFKEKISLDLNERGIGKKAVNYKLRDWLFSRQHFWGEPFPILHELDSSGKMTGKVRALKPDDLPIDIPKEISFNAEHNSPEPPLESAPEHWLYVTIEGKKYKRETNTMPQWAGSCWYYLRYIDPKNREKFVDPELEKSWMPVDLYVGGAEHAVLHLLYARFWHKVLFDRGYLSMTEPFHKLVNQGMILGEMEFTGFRTEIGTKEGIEKGTETGSGLGGNANCECLTPGNWVSANLVNMDRCSLKSDDQVKLESVKLDVKNVVKKGDVFVLVEDESIQVDSRANKMSKSRGNVVNPDDVVEQHGADSLRLYEMFMGPLEAVKPWSTDGVSGVRGFLDRVWRMIVQPDVEDRTNPNQESVLHNQESVLRNQESILRLNPAVQDVLPNEEQNRMLHRTIKFVTHDVRNMSFNTAIAKMMEFTNFFLKQEVRPRVAIEQFILLLSPFAPHLCEELWELLGHEQTLAYENWPVYDEMAIRESNVEIPISINGKVRSKIVVPFDCSPTLLEETALADLRIVEQLQGKTVLKKIIVPGKMVNLVVK
ncbi:MAG: leucine--tRNA ligase [Thermoguttaceae bacterium]